MEKIGLKVLKNISKTAYKSAEVAANTTSIWVSHQPEMSFDVKKLKKR
ncbi:MAG: cyclic lactone autoinducer peptide [Clostridioides sp.]|jgi:cyclic lactone autoinducer peptide|nr:cyclic lactone autoinducer peptide [Clostridioides sp.]